MPKGWTDRPKKDITAEDHHVDQDLHLGRFEGSDSTATPYGTRTRPVTGKTHHWESPSAGRTGSGCGKPLNARLHRRRRE